MMSVKTGSNVGSRIEVDPMVKLNELKEENDRLNFVLSGICKRWNEYYFKLEDKAKEYREKMEILREKKKKEMQDNKLVLQNYKSGGSKVFITDDLWKVVIVIMSGIEMSVRAFDYETKQYSVTARDFKSKNIFEINHSSLENYKTAKFIDFAPTIFNNLRKLSGIFPEQYIESLGPEVLSKVITGNLDTFEGLTTAGKSGSLFFTSADKKYLVKTISKEEFSHFMKILPYYKAHIGQNPLSLLNRIYGLHKIEMQAGDGTKEKFTIVVMQNIMCTTNYIFAKYDLKGSTYKRSTKSSEFQTVPGKDLNFLDSKLTFGIPVTEYRQLISQLDIDVKFMASQNIIDYSLLVGIHDKLSQSAKPARENLSSSSKNRRLSGIKDLDSMSSQQTMTNTEPDAIRRNLNRFETCDGKYTIYCGIIDIFTVFNLRKKSEFVLKRTFLGKGVSCVPPNQYASRFHDFMKEIVFKIGDTSQPGSPVHSGPKSDHTSQK